MRDQTLPKGFGAPPSPNVASSDRSLLPFHYLTKGHVHALALHREGGQANSQRYIGRRELRQLFPVSDMTIWRWMHDPEIAFPRPVKLGRNGRNFWWYPAIVEWERLRKHACGFNLENQV